MQVPGLEVFSSANMRLCCRRAAFKMWGDPLPPTHKLSKETSRFNVIFVVATSAAAKRASKPFKVSA